MGKKFKNYENRALENTCLSIIRWGVYLTLFTPLIISRSSFFPFVTPKTLYFRILVEIIFAAFLVLAIFSPRYRPKVNLVFIAIFSFVLVSVLASIFGINFERSFWSTYERMTGLFTLFHLLIFFVVLSSCFKKKEDWEKIFSVSIIVGVLLSLYILMATEISTRGGGTIGNTSFMAAYLLFDVFFALILFLEKKTSGWRIFSGISLILLIAVLLTSTARGAIISFFGGLFLLGFSYLIFSGKKNLKRAGVFLILILIGLGTVLAVFQPSFVKNGVNELLAEMKPRFVVWEKGWKGFLEKPVLGWGPENFNAVFTKFFNPCMFLPECGSEIWFDRVHNIVLDILVTTGVLGLLSYLFIFAASIFGLLRTYLREKEDIFSFFGIMALLAIYFFQNLLVFDMISSYTVFFLSLGFVSFLTEKKSDWSSQAIEIEPGQGLTRLVVKGFGRNILLFVIIIFTGLFLYFGNIQPSRSASHTVKMITSSESLEEAIDHYHKALNTFMEKYEMREQFAQKVYRTGFDPQSDREALESAFALAEEQMEESIRKNSLDFRPHLFLGRLYFSDFRFSQDREKLDLAERTFEKAIELGPNNQQTYWHLAEVKFSKPDIQSAQELFQKAIDLEPRLGTSHWYLAMFYRMTAQYESALEKIKEAGIKGYEWKQNLGDFSRVVEIYQILGDDLALVSLYQEVIEIHPENAELWMGLAASFANLGEIEKAKEAAFKVREIDPTLASKVEEFLKNLEE